MPFPSPGDLPNPGIEPGSPTGRHCRQTISHLSHHGRSIPLKTRNFPLKSFQVTMSVCFLTLSTLEIMCSKKASPGGSGGKESTCQCRKCGFDPWVGKMPWRRKWQPTPVFLARKSHGPRSLVGYHPWGCKELDMTERLHFPFPDMHQQYSRQTSFILWWNITLQ